MIKSRSLVFMALAVVVMGLMALDTGMQVSSEASNAQQAKACPEMNRVLPAGAHYSVANTDCAGIHEFLRNNPKQSMEAFLQRPANKDL